MSQKKKAAREYVQAKMVDWFQPNMLLNIALKAVISGTFGNYADRRETQAALDTINDWDDLKKEYGSEGEIWIDIVNDTGDGFNSTFAIAKSVARKELVLRPKGAGDDTPGITTPRGRLLVFGGDEVYPFPTAEAYTAKFKIPFGSAADDPAEVDNPTDRPHLYAIPGNHDWYDGLGNFIKIFCQQRWIGIWSTQQHRSYFARPLTGGYWLWATDIQLNSDIDTPQLRYFRDVARNHMQDGDKIILLTAEPAWVYNEIHNDDRSFSKLKFFVDRFIHNKHDTIGKTLKLAATLTGDLHHYARYADNDKPNGHQYITAGGGGAFLHLTHNLPDRLRALRKDEGDIHCKKTFPDDSESKKLLAGNFTFPVTSRRFTAMLWGIYVFFFCMLHNNENKYFGNMSSACSSAWTFILYTTKILLRSPGTLLMSIAIGLGFWAFSDRKVMKKGAASAVGALHGILQVAMLYATMYFIGMKLMCDACATDNWLYNGLHGALAWTGARHDALAMLAWRVITMLVFCAAGSILAGLIMGIYLYCSNRALGMHLDEASSSLGSPDYKNFLRLHVHQKGVTIYPVGIRRVPRKWKQTVVTKKMPDGEEETRYRFSGDEEIKPFLIEGPIEILNDQL